MRQRMFLKLDGVRGESENPRHYGEIEIIGFSWGDRSAPLTGSGGGPGKASISELTIFKNADKTSPLLRTACHSGQGFAGAVLTVENIAEWGSMVSSRFLELRSVVISSFRPVGAEQEELALNFDGIRIKPS